MRRKHLFAFYCTLLLPIGALIGVGAGEMAGVPLVLTVFLGAGLGVVSSYLLLRATGPGEEP
jgi:hypothetical protein